MTEVKVAMIIIAIHVPWLSLKLHATSAKQGWIALSSASTMFDKLGFGAVDGVGPVLLKTPVMTQPWFCRFACLKGKSRMFHPRVTYS